MGRKKCGRKGSRARRKAQKNRARSVEANETAEERMDEQSDYSGETEPIDVYARLSCYFKQEDPNEVGEEDPEEQKEYAKLELWPRFVFSSSLCMICMRVSDLACERCAMVFYCSIGHLQRDETTHRDLCAALCSIARGFRSSKRFTADEYRVYRLKSLEMLESEVGRPLKLWEREIVLYPRACRVCRDFCAKNLDRCTGCDMEFFCAVHASDGRKEHAKWCKDFLVFRNCSLRLPFYPVLVLPRFPEDRFWKTAIPLPSNFDQLMLQIYGDTSYYRKMNTLAYSNLSQACTSPLTALYAAQLCRPDWRERTDWAIDVVGAEYRFEGVYLYYWEKCFLHLLPNAKRLSLRLVGPELELPVGVQEDDVLEEYRCSGCRSSGRIVRTRFYPEKLYHEIGFRQGSSAPDLVCLFNPGLYRETGFEGRDTWPETIREFCASGAPAVVTSYTEDEIPRETKRIKSICDVEVLLDPCRNPFSSIKPERNFVSDDKAPFIYKNYCLAIVRGKASLFDSAESRLQAGRL